jgi:hypothetical protein
LCSQEDINDRSREKKTGTNAHRHTKRNKRKKVVGGGAQYLLGQQLIRGRC